MKVSVFCLSIFVLALARISSSGEVGVTDSLDLLLEVGVCFLRLGGFTAGLFGIELERNRQSAPCPVVCPHRGKCPA